VRDTDINQYLKKGIHLLPYALKILKNADKIIFLSTAYRDKLVNHFFLKRNKNTLLNKSIIIPNGISEFWLENKNYETVKYKNNKKIHLLFVGKIQKRKNIHSIVKVTNYLNDKFLIDFELTLIGEILDDDYYKKMKKIGTF